MQGPLKGVRVIEFAGIGPGPFCAMMLADLGADVVAIDRPNGGDQLELMRRGRRSVVLDLKHEPAREAVLRLAERSEILIDPFRPGVAERLGLGPDECLARNPALVYGRMTGFGQEGPLAQEAGHDIDYIAYAGALHAIGGERPVPPLNLVGDFGGGGMLLAFGLLCGLVEARRSGCGQVVDAAMVDGAALTMTMFYELFGRGHWANSRRSNLLDGGAYFNDVYRCADDRWIAVGAIEPQFRRALFDALDIPYADEDLGLGHRERWPAMRERLETAFLARPRDAWIETLQGLDACVAPVLDLEEAPRHPHAVARGSFLERDGSFHPAPAPRFSATPAAEPRPVPRLGAHGAEVLAELGFSDQELEGLLSGPSESRATR